ncbi:MAG: histidinol dehydrogenase, partial [Clostridiaceae bacterium]|nr:histidinol dehydrogenase [Clostridiaceae bacterium]
MLRILSWEDKGRIEGFLSQKSDSFIRSEVTEAVKKIVQDVRDRGDIAVLEYSRRFDNVGDIKDFRVSTDALEEAAVKADDAFIAAISKSIANVKSYQNLMLDKEFNIMTDNGSILGSRVTAIDRAAIYVPGGKATYPSTLVMCAVPAIIAGVREIIILTPPSTDGSINPYVAATAK